MFPQKYYDGFDRCFRYIEDSSDALLEKSALYCTAQWICDHFGKKRLSLDDVNIIMKSEELQQIRERFLLDKFSIEGHEYYLCLLCNMIHTCKLYDVRAKLFYLYYIPSAVTNRSIFQELPDDDLLGLIPSLQNGPHSCMMIHLVLALAQEHWGTKEIFDLVEGNVYLQWINTVGDPTVQIDEFIEYWYAVHTLDAEHIMRKRQKVEDAVKV